MDGTRLVLWGRSIGKRVTHVYTQTQACTHTHTHTNTHTHTHTLTFCTAVSDEEVGERLGVKVAERHTKQLGHCYASMEDTMKAVPR